MKITFTKNLKKFFIAAAAFSTFSLYAESWHICLGSYKNMNYAQELVEKLKNKNFESFISEYRKNESELFYRVLLADKNDTRTKAYEQLDNLKNNAAFNSLKIRGAWCLAVEDSHPETAAQEIPANAVLIERIIEVVKEVPVEVIKEVPVEKIVEVIKEVPVEVEKTVEKEDEIKENKEPEEVPEQPDSAESTEASIDNSAADTTENPSENPEASSVEPETPNTDSEPVTAEEDNTENSEEAADNAK